MARLSQVFTGKDRVFFDLFEEAAANVVRGADLLDQMLAHYPDRADLSRDIVICEQEGDRITHDVHQRLNSTFVTPIDREDVLRLISDLDDIIDLIDEVSDYLGLYKIEAPMEQSQRLAHVLLQATRQISDAMPRLRSFDVISHYTVEIHRLENDGDRISRDAIASLFEAGIDPLVVIRWKDIFERLEEAIDACEDVANTLEGIVIKKLVSSDVVLVIVVVTALAFDFTNGFHDTANAIATSVSTRAMSPRFAVLLSAVLNFAGAFISLEVAATVGSGIVESDAVTTTVVFAGLIGAIAWNLATWYFGLPSSSSHALIGGLVGAAFAASGPTAIQGDGLVEKVIAPGIVAPILAFTVAGIAILIAYRIVGRLRPGPVNRAYRLGQLVSGSMFSLAHGTNDAQKTMGIITLALIAHGDLSASNFEVPTWVVVSSAAAIALGTYTGGWRIIRTVGSRIIKMDPAQGFSAQGSGAAVMLAASHLGYPLSTTHVISGGVMGAGAATRLSAVRWGVAGNIAIAWTLTLPASALIGATVYAISSVFGSGTLGPILVSLSILGVVLAFFGPRLARGQVLTSDA